MCDVLLSLGVNPTAVKYIYHIIKLQQVLGDETMSSAQAFCWHNMFFEGRTLVEDKQVTAQYR
jgi:hypothetical protein